MIEPFVPKFPVLLRCDCSDLSESQMEEIKSLRMGDKILFKGVKLTVICVSEYDGKIFVPCEPIPAEEAKKLGNFPKPKSWNEQLEEWQQMKSGRLWKWW